MSISGAAEKLLKQLDAGLSDFDDLFSDFNERRALSGIPSDEISSSQPPPPISDVSSDEEEELPGPVSPHTNPSSPPPTNAQLGSTPAEAAETVATETSDNEADIDHARIARDYASGIEPRTRKSKPVDVFIASLDLSDDEGEPINSKRVRPRTPHLTSFLRRPINQNQNNQNNQNHQNNTDATSDIDVDSDSDLEIVPESNAQKMSAAERRMMQFSGRSLPNESEQKLIAEKKKLLTLEKAQIAKVRQTRDNIFQEKRGISAEELRNNIQMERSKVAGRNMLEIDAEEADQLAQNEENENLMENEMQVSDYESDENETEIVRMPKMFDDIDSEIDPHVQDTHVQDTQVQGALPQDTQVQDTQLQDTEVQTGETQAVPAHHTGTQIVPQLAPELLGELMGSDSQTEQTQEPTGEPTGKDVGEHADEHTQEHTVDTSVNSHGSVDIPNATPTDTPDDLNILGDSQDTYDFEGPDVSDLINAKLPPSELKAELQKRHKQEQRRQRSQKMHQQQQQQQQSRLAFVESEAEESDGEGQNVVHSDNDDEEEDQDRELAELVDNTVATNDQEEAKLQAKFREEELMREQQQLDILSRGVHGGFRNKSLMSNNGRFLSGFDENDELLEKRERELLKKASATTTSDYNLKKSERDRKSAFFASFTESCVPKIKRAESSVEDARAFLRSVAKRDKMGATGYEMPSSDPIEPQDVLDINRLESQSRQRQEEKEKAWKLRNKRLSEQHAAHHESTVADSLDKIRRSSNKRGKPTTGTHASRVNAAEANNKTVEILHSLKPRSVDRRPNTKTVNQESINRTKIHAKPRSKPPAPRKINYKKWQ